MPLSNDCSLVSLLLKQLRECLLTTVERRAVIGKAIGKTMLAGKHAGA